MSFNSARNCASLSATRVVANDKPNGLAADIAVDGAGTLVGVLAGRGSTEPGLFSFEDTFLDTWLELFEDVGIIGASGCCAMVCIWTGVCTWTGVC